MLSGYNDLETRHPLVAREWHPTKNGDLKPYMVMHKSRKKVWWLGSCGHEWQATIKDRVDGTGCPICKGKQILCGENDLATLYPNIAKEWHPTKNGELTPYMIAPKSGKKVWWICEKGHEWQALVSDRTNGIGCPICSKETHTSFPEQALFYYIKQYFPDVVSGNRERIGLELDIYIPSMNIAVEYDGYNWHKDNLNERRKNQLCKENDIFLIRVRENGLELFDDCCCIVRKDRKHNSSLNQIVKEIFSYIDNTIEIDVDVDRDESKIYESYILTTKSKSLESTYPQIAQEWHPTKNGQLKPDMVTFGSGKRVWWICEKGHEWQACVNWRVQGNGCPVCANQQILSGYNDLETKYPLVAKEWHPTKNGELNPNMVASRSSKKAWWMCEKGHEWEASISSRTDGRGCPICANKKILPGYNDLATKNPKLARELIIALPEIYTTFDPQQVLEEFTNKFRQQYGVECVSALHHNKRKTNYHIHLIFSERKLLPEPDIKIATRSVFYDETGKRVRTKKEITDENGQVRKGCTVIKKGEVYESHLFTTKDERFKTEAFIAEAKEVYTELINSHISDPEQRLKVFDKNSVYLPTKKIGKNNPKAAEIEADNTARQEWNRTADLALISGIEEAKILEIKQTEIHDKAGQSIRENGWLPNLFRGIVGKAKEFLQAIIREKDMPPKPVLNMDMDEFRTMQTLMLKVQKQAKAIKKIQEVTLPNLRQQLAETTGIFKGKERKALEKQIQQIEAELDEKLDKLPDILTDDGYPDVQAFMKTYRKAEAIVIQYNQDLAEWEQAVKNGQKPAEKQHRPPERQSVRNRLRQLQEDGKQNSQPKQRKKSQDRER